MGIEPTSSAWKAEVLPLNYTRMNPAYLANNQPLQQRSDIGLATVVLRSFNLTHLACLNARSGGGGRIRTYVGLASRFTVCPR